MCFQIVLHIIQNILKIKSIKEATCDINSGYSSEMNMGIQDEQWERSAAALFTVQPNNWSLEVTH